MQRDVLYSSFRLVDWATARLNYIASWEGHCGILHVWQLHSNGGVITTPTVPERGIHRHLLSLHLQLRPGVFKHELVGHSTPPLQALQGKGYRLSQIVFTTEMRDMSAI